MFRTMPSPLPPLFTVFTPTYNRAQLLHRPYESLRAQTDRAFEWLIIDDGSADGTRALVERWQRDATFPIRYVFQPNTGKHLAHNRAVTEARGSFFLTLDSDDACVPEAIARLRFHWERIPESEQAGFSGVGVLCRDQNGEIVGDPFPYDTMDSTPLEMAYRFKVRGEKWGFQRTDILREYPFAVGPNQGYIPEGLVWHRIAKRYRLRYVNEALRVYYTDAPSMTRGRAIAGDALGLQLFYEMVLNEHLSYFRYAPLAFGKAAAQYVRASLHRETPLAHQWRQLRRPLGRALWLAALPLARVLYRRDRRRGHHGDQVHTRKEMSASEM
jgi:glycosyltransferase involved in cell wall biosynthesis